LTPQFDVPVAQGHSQRPAVRCERQRQHRHGIRRERSTLFGLYASAYVAVFILLMQVKNLIVFYSFRRRRCWRAVPCNTCTSDCRRGKRQTTWAI
jgi:hypothetical protein